MINSLALALLLLQQTPVNPEAFVAEHRMKITKASGTIVVDGQLSEPAWNDAPVAADFTQSEPLEGGRASEETEVKILYDHDNLYFGIVAHDREPDRIIISDLKKDFEAGQGDNVQIVLDTFHDGRNGYMFAINAAGAKWDAQMGNEGREMNSSWDGVWFARARVTSDGWIGEIAIPFKTLKFRDAEVQTWGINVQRSIRRRNEQDYWSPLPRIYTLERVSRAGTLEGIEGIKPGLNLKLKPYVTGTTSSVPGKTTNVGDWGVDAKYGITSGLTWDFTYNTDFSQVEADTQQINLTRFSLFFPEKRDFFLENSGVFVFGNNEGRGPIGFNSQNMNPGGSGTVGGGRQNNISNDLILFFSRRIGLSDEGQSIPIFAGSRLTGRVGRFEVGLLNIQQKEYGLAKATNFSVARLKRNVLANSDIGLMILNKDQAGPDYNRVYGLDANFRLHQNYYFSTYLANTSSNLTQGRGRTGAGRVSGGYKVNLWDIRMSYVQIAPNFRDEMGYVPRTGVKNQNNHAGIHLRPKRYKRWLREVGPHVATEYNVGPDGHLDTRYTDYHVRLQFQDGASMEVGVNPSYERLIKPFTIGKTDVPVGAYSFNEWFVSGNTNTSRNLSVNGRFGTGNFYDGYKRSYQAGTIIRLSHRVNTQLSYSRNNIDLLQRKFSNDLASVRFNYAFSTVVFLNALVQYNSDTRQISSNVRFNIIHRPLSDFFIVYNERRDSATRDVLNRAVIAKVTYMVSR